MQSIHESVWVAPGVQIYGKVTIGAHASLWPNAVIRAEAQSVTIGRMSNVQDFAMIHVGFDHPTAIGEFCSITHHATVHGATIGDHCLIGPNCIIMDSDDHPINPLKRMSREPVAKEEIQPVRIGNNVWIGSYCAILKGVTIGDNTIVATHSVVTRDAVGNCVYAGFPARPTLRDIDKSTS